MNTDLTPVAPSAPVAPWQGGKRNLAMRRYDRHDTLFYLDPPYWGCEDDYGRDLFSREEFARLAEELRTIQGHWMLSINDVPEIRQLFAWASVEPVTTTYSISRQGAARGQRAELLIANFAL